MTQPLDAHATLPATLAEDWLAAWHFAAQVHNAQRVPGTDLPYLKHLGMVAMEVFGAHAIEPVGDLGLAVRRTAWPRWKACSTRTPAPAT